MTHFTTSVTPTTNIVVSTLHAQPALLLFLIIAVGAAVGSIKVRDVSLGPAPALFAGLAISAYDPSLRVPAAVGTVGLGLFAYAVGVSSGPEFFSGLRAGGRAIAIVLAAIGAAAALTVLLAQWLGLPMPQAAGAFAGALNASPALAAATERLHGSPDPTVGYSMAYLGGLMIMLAVALVAGRGKGGPRRHTLTTVTVHVTCRDNPTVRQVVTDVADLGAVRMTQISPAGGALPVVVTGDQRLAYGDLVAFVAPSAAAAAIVERLGYISAIRLDMDRADLDGRVITVTSKACTEHTIGALDLQGRFGATVTRIMRGEESRLARNSDTLRVGDRLQVLAPHAQMKALKNFLGDSQRGASDLNAVGLAVGLCLGLVLGAVALPLGGGASFVLGSAAGPLMVGLIAGRAGKTGPLTWTLPPMVTNALTQLGLYMFLAYAGSQAGGQMLSALGSPAGAKLFTLGIIVTAAFAALVYAGCRQAGFRGASLAGMVVGAQTQPALLAFANDQADGDGAVNRGYALIYPAAIVAKIIIATLLAGMAL